MLACWYTIFVVYMTENPLLDPNSMDSHLIRGVVIDLDDIKPQTDLEA